MPALKVKLYPHIPAPRPTAWGGQGKNRDPSSVAHMMHASLQLHCTDTGKGKSAGRVEEREGEKEAGHTHTHAHTRTHTHALMCTHTHAQTHVLTRVRALRARRLPNG